MHLRLWSGWRGKDHFKEKERNREAKLPGMMKGASKEMKILRSKFNEREVAGGNL